MLSLPNLVTISRIASIPCFVVCYYLPLSFAHSAAAAIFGAAALTDWLDGYLARRLSQTSKLGAFLDPVADKLMVAIVLVVLLESYHSLWLALPAAVIIGREIAVSALREWMAEIGARKKIAVSHLGKVKTALQMTALVLLIIAEGPDGAFGLYMTGMVFLYLAMIITLWTMFVYLLLAWPELSDAQ